MSLRIAIATPTPHHRCETFIRAHIQRLDKVVLVLTDGSLPSADGSGRPLLGSSKPDILIARLAEVLFKRDRKARLRKRIVRKLRDERIDIVLAEYGNTAAEMLPCCQRAGIPLVAYFLGFDAYREEQLQRYHNYKGLFTGAAKLIAVSQAMRTHLIALGAPPEKVVYNSCGADPELFISCDPSNAPPHFLAVGRFVDKKAPHLTVLAFARVLRLRPEARLTLVGGGELWETCQQLVRAHGMEHAVDLCGTKSPQEIAELLQRTRAFVQHSVVTSANDREGTPVAMLEAMGAGVPVISTRHGDIEELVAHNERGWLVAERDVEAMATYMLHLIENPEEAGRMGRNAAAYVRSEHLLHDRIDSLDSILRTAIREHRS